MAETSGNGSILLKYVIKPALTMTCHGEYTAHTHTYMW